MRDIKLVRILLQVAKMLVALHEKEYGLEKPDRRAIVSNIRHNADKKEE